MREESGRGGGGEREPLHSSSVECVLILHYLLMRRKEGEITADKKLGRVRSEAHHHTRVLLSV